MGCGASKTIRAGKEVTILKSSPSSPKAKGETKKRSVKTNKSAELRKKAIDAKLSQTSKNGDAKLSKKLAKKSSTSKVQRQKSPNDDSKDKHLKFSVEKENRTCNDAADQVIQGTNSAPVTTTPAVTEKAKQSDLLSTSDPKTGTEVQVSEDAAPNTDPTTGMEAEVIEEATHNTEATTSTKAELNQDHTFNTDAASGTEAEGTEEAALYTDPATGMEAEVSGEAALNTDAAIGMEAEVTEEAAPNTEDTTGTEGEVTEEAAINTNAATGLEAEVTDEAALNTDATTGAEAEVTEEAALNTDATAGTEAEVTEEAALNTDAATNMEVEVTGEAALNTDAAINMEVEVTGEAALNTDAATNMEVEVNGEAALNTDAVTNMEVEVTGEAALNTDAATNMEVEVTGEAALNTDATTGTEAVVTEEAALNTDATTGTEAEVTEEAALNTDAAINMEVDVTGEAALNTDPVPGAVAGVTDDAALNTDAVTIMEANVTGEAALNTDATTGKEAVVNEEAVLNTDATTAMKAEVTEEAALNTDAAINMEVEVTGEAALNTDATTGKEAEITEEAALNTAATTGTEAVVTEEAALNTAATTGTEAVVTEEAALNTAATTGTEAVVTEEAALNTDAATNMEVEVTGEAALNTDAAINMEVEVTGEAALNTDATTGTEAVVTEEAARNTDATAGTEAEVSEGGAPNIDLTTAKEAGVIKDTSANIYRTANKEAEITEHADPTTAPVTETEAETIRNAASNIALTTDTNVDAVTDVLSNADALSDTEAEAIDHVGLDIDPTNHTDGTPNLDSTTDADVVQNMDPACDKEVEITEATATRVDPPSDGKSGITEEAISSRDPKGVHKTELPEDTIYNINSKGGREVDVSKYTASQTNPSSVSDVKFKNNTGNNTENSRDRTMKVCEDTSHIAEHRANSYDSTNDKAEAVTKDGHQNTVKEVTDEKDQNTKPDPAHGKGEGDCFVASRELQRNNSEVLSSSSCALKKVPSPPTSPKPAIRRSPRVRTAKCAEDSTKPESSRCHELRNSPSQGLRDNCPKREECSSPSNDAANAPCNKDRAPSTLEVVGSKCSIYPLPCPQEEQEGGSDVKMRPKKKKSLGQSTSSPIVLQKATSTLPRQGASSDHQVAAGNSPSSSIKRVKGKGSSVKDAVRSVTGRKNNNTIANEKTSSNGGLSEDQSKYFHKMDADKKRQKSSSISKSKEPGMGASTSVAAKKRADTEERSLFGGNQGGPAVTTNHHQTNPRTKHESQAKKSHSQTPSVIERSSVRRNPANKSSAKVDQQPKLQSGQREALSKPAQSKERFPNKAKPPLKGDQGHPTLQHRSKSVEKTQQRTVNYQKQPAASDGSLHSKSPGKKRDGKSSAKPQYQTGSPSSHKKSTAKDSHFLSAAKHEAGYTVNSDRRSEAPQVQQRNVDKTQHPSLPNTKRKEGSPRKSGQRLHSASKLQQCTVKGNHCSQSSDKGTMSSSNHQEFSFKSGQYTNSSQSLGTGTELKPKTMTLLEQECSAMSGRRPPSADPKCDGISTDSRTDKYSPSLEFPVTNIQCVSTSSRSAASSDEPYQCPDNSVNHPNLHVKVSKRPITSNHQGEKHDIPDPRVSSNHQRPQSSNRHGKDLVNSGRLTSTSPNQRASPGKDSRHTSPLNSQRCSPLKPTQRSPSSFYQQSTPVMVDRGRPKSARIPQSSLSLSDNKRISGASNCSRPWSATVRGEIRMEQSQNKKSVVRLSKYERSPKSVCILGLPSSPATQQESLNSFECLETSGTLKFASPSYPELRSKCSHNQTESPNKMDILSEPFVPQRKSPSSNCSRSGSISPVGRGISRVSSTSPCTLDVI